MKTKTTIETVSVRSERLVDAITKLNLEGRKILGAEVVSEDKYILHLGRRKTKPSRADIGLSTTKETALPRTPPPVN